MAYRDRKDFKRYFLAGLRQVLVLYPGARVEQVHGGLLLKPSPCHVRRRFEPCQVMLAEHADPCGQCLSTYLRRVARGSIPKRLRIFFRYDRKLMGKLAGCAWRALKLYFEAYFDDAGVNPRAVGFVQTAGELFNFHPHVHVHVTDGGFVPGGTLRPLAWLDSGHVERLFRAEVLRILLEKELITEAIGDNLLEVAPVFRTGLAPQSPSQSAAMRCRSSF